MHTEQPEPIVEAASKIPVRVLDNLELLAGRAAEEQLHSENVEAINHQFRGQVRKALE